MIFQDVLELAGQALFSDFLVFPQFKIPLVTVALNELKMQVYFSWQLPTVLGNMKLLFRITTIKFQSTKITILKKDKMSCYKEHRRGALIPKRTLCSLAAPPLLTFKQTVIEISLGTKIKNKIKRLES